MIELINFWILIVSAFLTFSFYIISVIPATLEKRLGESAYKICGKMRTFSGIFMIISGIGYVIYYFYPLELPIPRYFPWNYMISFAISAVIFIPSMILILAGFKAAGKETSAPVKTGDIFNGIYLKIRHPQYLGEVSNWFSFAFVLNSPFLLIFSIIWILIYSIWIIYEEKDLEIRFGKNYRDYKLNTGIFPKK